MEYFKVILKGFWNEDLFKMTTWAEDRAHAIKIAGAVYNHCYKNAVCTV